jgi:drug/metabolite transporter (DMT)-like permease
MSATALSIVLFAAFLHASWNALVKGANDRALTLAGVACTHTLVGIVMIAVSAPPAQASWPMIATSSIVHFGYYVLLFQAYRLGDLSQVYPISRGVAPALVAIGAYLAIGERLTGSEWLGLALITLGIGVLSIQRGAAKADRRAIGVAILLGVSIAAYSVADGIGVRWSGSSTGYTGWLFLFESPVVLGILAWRKRNGTPFNAKVFAMGLLGGLFAAVAYGLVLYVKTFAPIGAVSAVRESSVVVAALIGVIVFGERPWRGRLVAAAIVAAGVSMMAVAG